MELSGDEAFLVLEVGTDTDKSRVRIVEDSRGVISEWTATTRVSPVYPCIWHDRAAPTALDFQAKSHLLLLGPIDPQRVFQRLGDKDQVWVSIGLFNVIVHCGSARRAQALCGWAAEHGTPFEYWQIKRGKLESAKTWNLQPFPNSAEVLKQLATFTNGNHDRSLNEALGEYGPLMAATLTRSVSVGAELRDELLSVHREVERIVGSWSKSEDAAGVYRTLGELLTVNAALSRYSSQTHAGTTPVFATECHFWSHSMLGIGVASVALRNIRHFLMKTLGAARIPERFATFELLRTSVPDLTDTTPDVDYLGQIRLAEQDIEDLVPLLVYFSARDGFRSTGLTLSAPLACISSGESPRWSLGTLTHEISHIIVRAILAEMYPDLDSDEELVAFADLRHQSPCASLKQELQRLLLFSIVKIVEQKHGQSPSLSPHSLRHMLQSLRHELDEIMSSTFDYLYFFGSELDSYIESIWTSWGTIPNVQDRISEYVVRSTCTVLSGHLKRPLAEEVALDAVVQQLERLASSNNGGRYVKLAIAEARRSRDSILDRVKSRRQVVKLVRHFLFSPQLATPIRAETKRGGDSSHKTGYDHKRLSLLLKPFDNPLEFVKAYARSTPTTAGSAWLFHALAFGYVA